MMKIYQKTTWFLIFLLALFSTVFFSVLTQAVDLSSIDNNQNRIEEGHVLYENGQYQKALTVLEESLKNLPDKEEYSLNKAAILIDLSLIHEKLGQLKKVGELSAQSISILNSFESSPTTIELLATALNIKGLWQLKIGQTEQAFTTWEEAKKLFQRIGDDLRILQININQAQALQSLGFFRRSYTILNDINLSLQNQPASLTKVVAERSLSNTLILTGDLNGAEKLLNNSLSLARNLSLNDEITSDLISLGNLIRLYGVHSIGLDNPFDAQEQFLKAIKYYEEAISSSKENTQKLKIYANELGIFVDILKLQKKNPDLQQDLPFKLSSALELLLTKIKPLIKQVNPNRNVVYAEINLVKNLNELRKLDKKFDNTTLINNLLTQALSQAQAIGDDRSIAYSLGYQGKLLEEQKQYNEAVIATQQALIFADNSNAKDILYQWQWQLARLQKNQGQIESSLVSYSQAIANLKALKNDLVAINPEIQFTFTEQIEPIYREYVELLLLNSPSQTRLVESMNTIDSLQLAELENFFHSTCIEHRDVDIKTVMDNYDTQAAIVYPIILSNSFEVLLKLPGKPILHYSTPIKNHRAIEEKLSSFTQILQQHNSDLKEILADSQTIYKWLLKPLEKDIATSGVKTLIFVPDSLLRGIPMAALHDGANYLIEKYNLALVPQLYFLESQAKVDKNIKILMGGLTKSSGGFVGLPHVNDELAIIEKEIPKNAVILNEDFTKEKLKERFNQLKYPILHLATHGQFSSQLEKTFVLTWQNSLNANELSDLLKTVTGKKGNPLELLVLSACQTLTGDKRASLGLAGIAIKAGAKSTLASLWPINDQATSILMGQFYGNLMKSTFTKAEALRKAQLTLLNDSRFQSPYFWAPYVLIGSWT